MLRVTAASASQQRTLRPIYAEHSALPYGGFLDTSFDRSVDIYPGMVMTKLSGENFTLFGFAPVSGTPAATNFVPFGLSAFFVAPKLGIDEILPTNTNNFSVWVGGNQAVFEVLAPAFDTSATWTNATDGSKQLLRVTLAGHAQGPGKLTTAASGANVSTATAATLINVVGSAKIIVSLDRVAG